VRIMQGYIATFISGTMNWQSTFTMDAIGVLNMGAGLMRRNILTMSKQTVFEGLKTAISRHSFPHYGYDDYQATILFESQGQFQPFDKFLDSIDTKGCKLNIYAERVNGHSDGVAVTVDDQIQHLGYMQSRLDMESKLKQWEHLLSRVLRTGANMHSFDYELFKIEFDEYEYHVFNHVFQKDMSKFLSDGTNYYISHSSSKIGGLNKIIFHMEFPN
jgi:hypothetical protein